MHLVASIPVLLLVVALGAPEVPTATLRNGVKLPMALIGVGSSETWGNASVTAAAVSLGMKVGFDLRDDVLVGVAMASFSVIMSMNGWHASASGKLGAEYGVRPVLCARTPYSG
mgnify:CR=1 FL=1